MKYCSPRAIEPRIPSYIHTNSTHSQSHSQNSKTDFCFKFCCDFERNRKEIIVTDILKATSNFNFQPQTTDIQAFRKLQNLNSVEILESALGELFET